MGQPLGFLMIGLVAIGAGAAAAAMSESVPEPAERGRTAPTAQVRQQQGRAAGAKLVMFETGSCGWCRRFHKELAQPYRSGPYMTRAPLRFATAGSRNNGGYKLSSEIYSVPTFVLVDGNGQEIDRRTGYPGDIESFHNQVHSMLKKAG